MMHAGTDCQKYLSACDACNNNDNNNTSARVGLASSVFFFSRFVPVVALLLVLGCRSMFVRLSVCLPVGLCLSVCLSI